MQSCTQLTIWRKVDETDPKKLRTRPGVVEARNIRQKLSIQLKIDLEPHEHVHLREQPLVDEKMASAPIYHDNDDDDKEGDDDVEKEPVYSFVSSNEELIELARKMDRDTKCQVKVNQLGDYLASITLDGGYVVPLKVRVVKR